MIFSRLELAKYCAYGELELSRMVCRHTSVLSELCGAQEAGVLCTETHPQMGRVLGRLGEDSEGLLRLCPLDMVLHTRRVSALHCCSDGAQAGPCG